MPVAAVVAPPNDPSSPPRFDLRQLGLSDVTKLGARLRGARNGARTMEEVAVRVVEGLYEGFRDPATGERDTALVRFYLTLPFRDLPPDVQAAGARDAVGTLDDETRCLALVASAGDEPAWKSRLTSSGHRAIPLPSASVLTTLPMVAQLVSQLGLDVASILAPDPAVVMELEQRTYNVFFVPEALGSPYIPAQADFVVRHRIRSVLGFGGVLPSGDVFAALLFTRVPVERNVADMFRNVAMNVKVAVLPFPREATFTQAEARLPTYASSASSGR